MTRFDGLDTILVCPQCRGGVQRQDDGFAYLCHACNLSYPVRDQIPIMLLDEASQLREIKDDR